jgi:phospholipid/cholesterol/gamma-HCH transport system substrate-binding protein
MDERVLKFRVGVVVVAAAAITVILIALLGAWPNPFEPRYTITMKFPEAPGVTVDTPVRKSGIQIGRVSGVELLDEGGVILNLKIDSKYKLYRNEECRISTGSVVTGDAVLEFVKTGVGPQELIKDTDYFGEGVVASSPFDVLVNLEGQMATAIGSIQTAGDEVTQLARRLNTLVSGNEDQLDSIIKKTDVALDSFNRAMSSFDEVVGDQEMREKLRKSLEELPEMFADARATLAQTRTTLEGFGRVSARAERNLANFEEFSGPLGERGEQIAEDLARTVRNVDELVSNLVGLTQQINSQEGTIGKLIQDPELYNRLNRVAGQFEETARKLPAIVDDVRIFTDKIARDPRILGAKGALDRRPSGAGLKLPLR